jgi:putative endonuclease
VPAAPADRRVARGRRGELIAGLLLQLRGYRVLGRRVRTPAGEVDLVCRRGRALVLVEVKRRLGDGRGEGREAIGARQAQRLARAGSWLAARHPWAREVRVDLVAVDGLRVTIVRDAVQERR